MPFFDVNVCMRAFKENYLVSIEAIKGELELRYIWCPQPRLINKVGLN